MARSSARPSSLRATAVRRGPPRKSARETFGIGFLCAIGGYLVVAAPSYFLVLEFSSNRHDREPEAAMTSAFFFDPIGAVLAFIAGVVADGRPKDESRGDG